MAVFTSACAALFGFLLLGFLLLLFCPTPSSPSDHLTESRQHAGLGGLGPGPVTDRASPAEGVHRLRHQRQASHPLHAAEQAHLPVPRVALRGVPVLREHHHGHDCLEHRRADDEGERALPAPGGGWPAGTLPSRSNGVCAEALGNTWAHHLASLPIFPPWSLLLIFSHPAAQPLGLWGKVQGDTAAGQPFPGLGWGRQGDSDEGGHVRR